MNTKVLLLITSVLFLSAPTAWAAATPQYELQWSFPTPTGVAVDAGGNVYVGNSQRIRKFDADGVFISEFGVGVILSNTGVGVDLSSGAVYVADQGSHSIHKFTSEGIPDGGWGSFGSLPGEFIAPRDVAVDAAGNVYVTDSGNHRVQKFTSTGVPLPPIGGWGSFGTANGQFSLPRGIAVDLNDNSVWVTERNNHRIQKFDSNGGWILTKGSVGQGDGEFRQPLGVSVDAAGTVYVVEALGSRGQVFDSAGNHCATFSMNGTGNGELKNPFDLEVNPDGSCVYVADTNNHRVQKFVVPIELHFDIMPAACPNKLNAKKKGQIPMAILGTSSFDISQVDASTVQLEGVSAKRWNIEDVATPALGGDECDCTTDGADGFPDLTLQFVTLDVVAVLGAISVGDELVLTITGNLLDGTPFVGTDCMIVKKVLDGIANLGPVPEPGDPSGETSYELSLDNDPSKHVQTVKYGVPEASEVRLTVFNVTGRAMRQLVSSSKSAGTHTVQWNTSDLPSGVYFYRLQVGSFTQAKKVVIVH